MGFALLHGFLAITISSYILWFILPMGQGLAGERHCEARLTGMGTEGNLVYIAGLARYEWVNTHSWIGVVVITLVFIHLLLHWRWLIESIKRLKNYFVKQQAYMLERFTAVCTLIILTAFEALSGIVIWIVMPRGVGGRTDTEFGLGRTFWGLERNVWVDLHAWVAVFMVAIIVIHLVIHWRWIWNVTFSRIGVRKSAADAGFKQDWQLSQNDIKINMDWQNYLSRAGMLVGLVGAICFMVSMLTFQLDYFERFTYMLFMIPLPFISLVLAKKWPLIGGSLLIILAVTSISVFLLFPIGIVWNQIGVWNELGWETTYTAAFVTVPLSISGTLHIISGIKTKKLT